MAEKSVVKIVIVTTANKFEQKEFYKQGEIINLGDIMERKCFAVKFVDDRVYVLCTFGHLLEMSRFVSYYISRAGAVMVGTKKEMVEAIDAGQWHGVGAAHVVFVPIEPVSGSENRNS